MKIFISYSAKDTQRVHSIAEKLRIDSKAEVHWWEGSQRPGQTAWAQIFQWINEADLVLVLVSGNVLHRALAVGNEVGYAKAKTKFIIPLIWESPSLWAKLLRKLGAKVGIGTEDLGCIGDLVHIRINEHEPEDGLLRLGDELKRLAVQKASKETQDAILAVAGLLTFGAMLIKG